eukprot:g593.t1
MPPPLEVEEHHPRSKHKAPVSYAALAKQYPDFGALLLEGLRLDYSNPLHNATLSKVLLQHFYAIHHFPVFPLLLAGRNLIPPVPRTATVLHLIADLFLRPDFCDRAALSGLRGLDVGCGVTGIFQMLGAATYDFHVDGIDIKRSAVESAAECYRKNFAEGKAEGEVRTPPPCEMNIPTFFLQPNPRKILNLDQYEEVVSVQAVGTESRTTGNRGSDDDSKGATRTRPYYAFTVCNPPYHEGLAWKRNAGRQLNYGGVEHELVTEGGEVGWAFRMWGESQKLEKDRILWCTLMVSRHTTVERWREWVAAFGKNASAQAKAKPTLQTKVVPFRAGKQVNWLLCWSFLEAEEIGDVLSRCPRRYRCLDKSCACSGGFTRRGAQGKTPATSYGEFTKECPSFVDEAPMREPETSNCNAKRRKRTAAPADESAEDGRARCLVTAKIGT